jgi:hypothetical protein
MKIILVLSTGLLFVLFLFSCTPREKQEPTVAIDLTTREIGITLIDTQWKVPNKEVSRGDTVVWVAPQNSDVYIQFMDDRLVGSYTQFIEKGQSLSKVIGKEARKGDNPYAVFIYEDSVYAVGESPPRLIVRAM